MINILYITYDGLTDPLGQSQILPYLCGLSREGYRFTILSFEKKAAYEQNQAKIREILIRNNITWVPMSFTTKPPLLSKLYDAIRMRRMASRLHRQQSFGMIHCRSYPAAEIGLRLKRKTGVRFLFDMRGFWANEKVDGGQWKLNSPLFRTIYRHYKKKEAEFLREADAVISLTVAAKEEMHRWPGFEKTNIDVIPCCADLELFDYQKADQQAVQAAREELQIPASARVISYLGSVGSWYMTREMFAFFRQLREKHPDFIMLILSKDNPERIRQDAQEAGVPHEAIRIRAAARNELRSLLAICDCSIFFIRPTYSKMASSPTKHAELMGMGLPVICNEIGDTGHIVRDTGTGMIVPGFDEKDYQQVIDKIDELLAIPAERIRLSAFQYFDLEEGIRRYSAIYKRLLSKPA